MVGAIPSGEGKISGKSLLNFEFASTKPIIYSQSLG
jgi:hypothetical protein